tara:strand:+ start:2401 stop:3585 length:1185 start_codon:yes stop_codon:yes gene_type:complete
MAGSGSAAGLGQYFTTDPGLLTIVKGFISGLPGPFLEPCAGAGHLVRAILSECPGGAVDAIEIDASLRMPEDMAKGARVNWETSDYLAWQASRPYPVIVANPPFARCGGSSLHVDFVAKALEDLKRGGTMVMIVPSDFFQLSRAADLLRALVAQGRFTDIHHASSERLFPGARIAVSVFRYLKESEDGQLINVNGSLRHINCTDGTITFHPPRPPGISLGRVANVHVGLVSGCDAVFKDPRGNVLLQTGLRKKERFWMAFSANDPAGKALGLHKSRLLKRRGRAFGPGNWYEWGAKRNYSLMTGPRAGEPCLFLQIASRSDEVCRVGRLGLFGPQLLCIVPRPGCHLNLEAIAAHLCSPPVREMYTQAGRYRITQRAAAHMHVPLSLIRHNSSV